MTRRFIVGLAVFAVLFVAYVMLSSRTGSAPQPAPAIATSPLDKYVAEPPRPRPSRGEAVEPAEPVEDPALVEKRATEEKEIREWRDRARVPAE